MAQIFGEKSKYLIKKENHHFSFVLITIFSLAIVLAVYIYFQSYFFGTTTAFVVAAVFLGAYLIIYKNGEKHLSISHKFNRGRNGEYDICDELQKLPNDYSIFRNIRISDKRGDTDIIVLGPTGIFTIEVKSHKGRIDFSGEELIINGRRLEKNFLGQAMGEALNLKDYLGENGISNIFVEPVLVFSNKYASVRFGFNKVKNVYVIQKGFLNNLILNNNGRLSPEFIALAKEALIQIV